jgi:hypothetical protein
VRHLYSVPKYAGCFDREDQAASAYDKMMVWCELHNTAGAKGGITNDDASKYECDIPWLRSIAQVCNVEGASVGVGVRLSVWPVCFITWLRSTAQVYMYVGEGVCVGMLPAYCSVSMC